MRRRPFPPHSRPRPAVETEPLEPRRLLAADLVVSQVAVAPTLLGGGGRLIRPIVIVRNVGDTLVTQAWSVRYAVSTDDEWGNADDVTLGRVSRAGLARGGAVTIDTPIRVPLLPNGTYHVVVLVDANNAVTEADETNNTAATTTAAITASDGTGELVINGTDAADDITLTIGGGAVQLATRSVGPGGRILTGGGTRVGITGLGTVRVNAGAGHDAVVMAMSRAATVDAGAGNDRVIGGIGPELLIGGPGHDRIHGGNGNDRLVGGGGHDRLYGETGNDTVSGGAGRDLIFGGRGADWLIGGAGDDLLFAFDDARDTVSGNAGNDLGQFDELDLVTSASPLTG